MLLALLACGLDPLTAPPARTVARPARKTDTFSVDCAGAAEFTDITSAIKEAHSGDTIEVAPCTYPEQIDFRGREIRIVATGGPELTTIAAPIGAPAVRAHRGEGPDTVLEGFTITGGGSDLEPVIEGNFSTMHLRDCVITGTTGTATVYARSAITTLERVTIDDTNVATGGFHLEGRRGQLVVKDSTIACNGAVGYTMEHGAAFVDGATFSCDGGNAISIFHSSTRIQRARVSGRLYTENEDVGAEGTVVEGSVLTGGASANTTDLYLRNTVLVGVGAHAEASNLYVESSVITGAPCGVDVVSSNVSMAHSDFWENGQDTCGVGPPSPGDGNLDADPRFTDAAAGDYTLQADSPCIDAGSAESTDRDPDGSPNDIGAYGGPFSLGGA